MTAALKPLDLTHAQFVVLASTRWIEQARHAPPSQREIADQAGTDPMMTSQIVRLLEQRGLLSRRRRLNDSRANEVRSTAAGRQLAARAVVVVEKADRAFFGGAKPDRLIGVLTPLATGPDESAGSIS